jgi:hypothetical protein
MLVLLIDRSTVAVAMFAGALLVGCGAPDLPTDLRTSGPPNVTAVMVMSDLRTGVDPGFPQGPLDLARLIETATHCRIGDAKRPGLVDLPTKQTLQVCPDDLSLPSPTEGTAEGAPPDWFVRVVFDKLLDPDVEELVPERDANGKETGVMRGSFMHTQPVTLTCNGADVLYDGYYVPNGNRVSWPLGPALFVQALDQMSVPTGATCEIGIKDIVRNKQGQPVPADQRSFTFQIAPMKLRFSAPDPSDDDPGKITVKPETPVKFYWTAVFTTMPDPAEIKIARGPNTADGMADATVCGAGGTPVAAADIATSASGTKPDTTALIMNLGLKSAGPKLAWMPNTTYRIEFGPSAKIAPKQGGPEGSFPAGYKLCFHTTAAM